MHASTPRSQTQTLPTKVAIAANACLTITAIQIISITTGNG